MICESEIRLWFVFFFCEKDYQKDLKINQVKKLFEIHFNIINTFWPKKP